VAEPVLYFDLGSPYAYLAFARSESVCGRPPELAPILLGALFALRGSGSWSQTPERPARVAELHERVAAYGLPPLLLPPGWPGNGLTAMRAATWAMQLGHGRAFAAIAFRQAFAEGRDITGLAALEPIAAQAGLPADQLAAAVASAPVKDALRDATEAAWEAGVKGVPTVRVGDALFYGDDQLERAASSAPMRDTPS
jgi:2-hydroxychromene-2-carboxylate isomerase